MECCCHIVRLLLWVQVWLLLDGMVLNVVRWLPEHPRVSLRHCLQPIMVETMFLVLLLQVWLLLDGMVLDVGRWLPEHPGGAAIIPAQSLNCDCSRFFEVRQLRH